jgi:hypothetical protein
MTSHLILNYVCVVSYQYGYFYSCNILGVVININNFNVLIHNLI